MTIEIGRGRYARKAYALDDIALVPSRRTRDPKLISTNWKIDAYDFKIPLIAAPMDSVMSPETAIMFGKLGGVGALNLEGLWTRYENPTKILKQIADLDRKKVNITAAMQEFYSKPVDPGLVVERLAQIKDSGVTVAASLSPQSAQSLAKTVIDAGVELFIIRGSTVSAEHVSEDNTSLNLKNFIYQLDVPVIIGGAVSYNAALHLMRTGAAGVLVGFGGASANGTRDTLGIHIPYATAIADVAEARRSYLDESGGRYVHVIADAGFENSGDIIKSLAMGADAVMVGNLLSRALESPGNGWYWGSESYHAYLPRGEREYMGLACSMEQILYGPSSSPNGVTNIVGAMRHAMAVAGYSDLKELQKIDIRVYTNSTLSDTH